jgi:hypothetical protein
MEAARTYRTRLPLRVAVAAAAALWGSVLLLLLRLPGADPRSILGAGAFAAFFAAFTLVYGRTSITVTEHGIVAASPLRKRPVRFDEIVEIVVQDGLAGRMYAVFTRRGLVRFTSLFARHRELFELLLRRAELSRRG